MPLNDILMVGFTAMIAVSTVVYTVVTHRLWKATQASVDVAKATALMAYLSTIANEIETNRETNPQSADQRGLIVGERGHT